jgi:hypothetical protein
MVKCHGWILLAAIVAVTGPRAFAHSWHHHDATELVELAAHAAPSELNWVWLAASGIACLAAIGLISLGRIGLGAMTALLGLLIAGCSAQPRGEKSSMEPAIARHFAAFKPRISIDWDAQYLLVSSDGLPDHPMMVGIKSWQQQVPLPQPYSGSNAWRIPLTPVKADRPVSARTALFRGAIALAVNGVPIFNALNNRKEDTYLAGELDDFGGHCGRGDDYHYHMAPVHLEKVVGKGKPIAYALDGYPIFGYTDAEGKEPNDLDDLNGREEEDGYKYYSTPTYPYINGGMRGKVTVRGDQIEPQPRDAPMRPPGQPLRGAVITNFTGDPAKGECALTYTLNGQAHTWRYGSDGNETWTFVMSGLEGKPERAQEFRRSGGKKR